MDRLPTRCHVEDVSSQQADAITAFLKIVIALRRNQQKKIMYLIKELRINTDNIGESYLAVVKYAYGLLLLGDDQKSKLRE